MKPAQNAKKSEETKVETTSPDTQMAQLFASLAGISSGLLALCRQLEESDPFLQMTLATRSKTGKEKTGVGSDNI